MPLLCNGPLIWPEIKGFRVFNLICGAEKLNALNSCSVPTLPCCLGIWPLFISIFFFFSIHQLFNKKAAITYCHLWRKLESLGFSCDRFAHLNAVTPIAQVSWKEIALPPLLFPLPIIPLTVPGRSPHSLVSGHQLFCLWRGSLRVKQEDITSSLSPCLDVYTLAEGSPLI